MSSRSCKKDASIGARGERTTSIRRLQKWSYGWLSAITSFAHYIKLYQIAPLAHDMPPSRRVSKNVPFARRRKRSGEHKVIILFCEAYGAIITIATARAVLGIEPRTSRTRSENHTTRPNSQLSFIRQHVAVAEIVLFEPRAPQHIAHVFINFLCRACVKNKPQEKRWTHWDLNPGPSACEADVIPLHHVPACKRSAKRVHCQPDLRTLSILFASLSHDALL